VSLAWPLARPQTSSILIGARTGAQLEDNLRALSVKLTSEDLKELDCGGPGRLDRFREE
jgi:aryl-alcohol dehydrogenase-like predicted oxidoreductase